MGGKCYLIVILIYISLTISDIEDLFMCLLAVPISPPKNCPFKFFAHILIGYICFLLLSHGSPFYVLGLNLPPDRPFVNILPRSMSGFFTVGSAL